jgi:hypothetical protein
MSADAPYTREELERVRDELPTRGPVCPKCGLHIPQFKLSSADSHRIHQLILQGQKIMAMHELVARTGCPRNWAKLWVQHSGKPNAMGTSAPCPYCGKPLVTALAKQCRYCLMDWHDEKKPKKLGPPVDSNAGNVERPRK